MDEEGSSMTKKILTVTLALALALAFLAGPAAAADKVYKWKGQTVFGLSSPLGQAHHRTLEKYVEEMSGGRLKITLHDAGEIVPPTKIFQAVAGGMLDFGANTPAWQKGKYPASDLFYTLPGGILEFNDLILWLYAGGGKELEQEMYGDKVVVFPWV
jgi:TRAP-type mannitol/chloroaromatic compound transport system substrate-binding protein